MLEEAEATSMGSRADKELKELEKEQKTMEEIKRNLLLSVVPFHSPYHSLTDNRKQ